MALSLVVFTVVKVFTQWDYTATVGEEGPHHQSCKLYKRE